MATDTYNKVFTMHGVIMIFLFLVPSVPATLGNFLIPMMIGAKDLALPKINLLSWYLYVAGGILVLYTMVAGGVDTGWTFTTPLSTHYLNTNVLIDRHGRLHRRLQLHLHRPELHRHHPQDARPGHDLVPAAAVCAGRTTRPASSWCWARRCWPSPSCWSRWSARSASASSIPPRAAIRCSSSILFWFYSHPAVYIMILPGMGVISEVISTFSRKRVFGYTAVAFSSVAIAVFGFFVWAHHMFIMGISNYSVLVFSLLTMLVAVPSAIKIFNWAFTLYKGSITFETPMLYAFGFMGLFTIGGMTGVFLGAPGTDIHLTETYFIVAHFHFVMVGGMLMAFLAGHPLLVAQDDRPHVSGEDLAAGRGGHVHRIQPDLLPAVHPGHAGHAAPLRMPIRRSSRCSTCSRLPAPPFSAWAICCRCSI